VVSIVVKTLRRKILEWLLSEPIPELKVGNGTVKIRGSYIDLPILTTLPTGVEGRVVYYGTDKKIKIFDGTEWKDVPAVLLLSKLSEGVWDSWPTADELASAMEAKAVSEGVALISDVELDADFVAQIFNSTNLSAGKIASILNDSAVSVSRAAEILNSGNLSTTKTAEILRNSNLSVSKARDILMDTKLSADRTQNILYEWNSSLAAIDRLLDLVTLDASSVTLTADTSYSGINRFRDLDLSGYIYTADGQPHVIIANSISIPSTSSIKKTETGGAGGSTVYGTGNGGNGGGGLIIIAGSITISGSVVTDGEKGEDLTGLSGRDEDGRAGGGGQYARVGTDVAGDGGKGGLQAWPGGSPGGGTGGCGGDAVCTWTSGVNQGGTATYLDFASYSDLAKELLDSMTDWWLVNVAGKSPTTTKSFPDIKGAGGGGGGNYSGKGDVDGEGDGAGGGGSGGEVIIVVNSVDFTGLVSAKGGDGGSVTFDPTAAECGGGGGGGGGIAYILYKSATSLTGTLTADGGAGGTGKDGPTVTNNGDPGTAGTAKAVAI